MDTKKDSTVRCLAALMAAALLASGAQGTIRSWESFTSFNQVRDMVWYQDAIWAATTGGLVRIDPDSATYQTFTNIDGLGVNRLFCLCVDGKDRLWVGGQGRLVDFTDPDHPDGYLLTDRDGMPLEIYDIECTPRGDSLWLASRLGVTLFVASDEPAGGLVVDTYGRFGEITRDTPARTIVLDGDSIWVGTDGGLAIGSRTDIRQLKAPSGWRSYFPSALSSLPYDSVKGLAIIDDTLYVGTPAGVYRLEREADTALVNLDLYGPPYVYRLSAVAGMLMINSNRGTGFYDAGVSWELPMTGLPISNTTCGVYDGSIRYWAGNLAYGIFRFDGLQMNRFPVGGTPVNECRGIVTAQGRIWGIFDDRSLAYYDDSTWVTTHVFNKTPLAVEVGPLGELWVATFGEGVYRIQGDSVVRYDTANSALSGLSEAPGFVVVWDIRTTGDAVWFANHRGVDGEVVAVNPYQTDQWQSYRLTGGAMAERVVTISAGQGVIYAGSDEAGIAAIAYNGTPFYTADDYRWEFTSANSGIGSDVIRRLAVDGYDSLWVGTGVGLSYQALGEVYFTNVSLPDSFGPSVTALAFDGQGSLYAGSGRGMVVRDIANGAFEHFTAKNSGLVDDVINDIYYERETRAVWIATAGGISRLTMPYALATEDENAVAAYPNPFVIRYGTERVRFNYAGMASIQIFTLAGELVREIPFTGEWDGDNAAGEPVASGVYLFVLTSRENEVGRGKILLVRE